jgi:hypothetical protein
MGMDPVKKIKAQYIASLPERTIRSVVTATTGVTSLATKLLVPKFIKESATYRVTFGMLQQFLIQKVAEVEVEEKEFEVKDQYMIRKTAGSVIEGIGLISVRFSPVWMLAIVSDVTGGSRTYLNRLITDLKKNKLIEEAANYDSIYALLDGINASSRMGVEAIDMPPITLEEFTEFKNSMTTNLKDNVNQSKKLMKDLEEVWSKMHQVGKKENISINKLSGAMTLDVLKKVSVKGYELTKSSTSTTFDILNEFIIKSYKESIDEVTKQGRKKYFGDHMRPFVKQLNSHFSKDHKTLTEKILAYPFGKNK